MKLEDQVTSLELSKRLKELGVKQNAFWSWYETIDMDDTPRLNRTDENCPVCCLPKQSFEEIHSAFTVAELGEMLPILDDDDIKYYYSSYREDNGTWEGSYYCEEETSVFYDKEGEEHDLHTDSADTEANARAKMLIYLLENKII